MDADIESDVQTALAEQKAAAAQPAPAPTPQPVQAPEQSAQQPGLQPQLAPPMQGQADTGATPAPATGGIPIPKFPDIKAEDLQPQQPAPAPTPQPVQPTPQQPIPSHLESALDAYIAEMGRDPYKYSAPPTAPEVKPPEPKELPKPDVIGGITKAAMAAVPTGLMEPVEQSLNMAHAVTRRINDLEKQGHPELKNFISALGPDWQLAISDKQDLINALNAIADKMSRNAGGEGIPAQPYADVTGAYQHTPHGFLGGQTPEQAEAGHPYATAAGTMAGGIPAALASGGGAGAMAKLPFLGRVGANAAIGGAYSSGFAGLDQASRQIKDNDKLELDKIAQAATDAFIPGAAFAGGLGVLGGIFGRKKGKPPAIKEEPPPEGGAPEVVPSKRDSWREYWAGKARTASAEEAPKLQGLAQAKLAVDKAAAKLEGALLKLDKTLTTRPEKTREILPSAYKELKEYIDTHGGLRKEIKRFVTSALSEEIEPKYDFATDNPIEETKQLVRNFLQARTHYDKLRTQAEAHVPLHDTVSHQVTDEEGRTHTVNITHREVASEYEFPTPELQIGYEELRHHLMTTYYEPFVNTFDKFVKKELKAGNELIKQIMPGLDAGSQAKILLTIGATAAYYLSNQEKAEAAEPPAGLVGRVLKSLKGGVEHMKDMRPVTRATGTQVTSDIIRAGFKEPIPAGQKITPSKKFGQVRDQYLTDLRRTLVESREMTPQEIEATKDMSPKDIPFDKEKLKGWTDTQRRKLAMSFELLRRYKKSLVEEMQRVEDLGGKHTGVASMYGMGRYKRMLQLDYGDVTGFHPGDSTFVQEFLSKGTGTGIQSLFLGNYRAATMHVLEALVAFISKHPKAAATASANMVRDPIYREYALANSPKGMFQQILEGQEKFGWQKKYIEKPFNERLEKAIKSLPNGEVIYDAMSAQLPERAKLGFGAVVTAEHNAAEYPGGPRQFMADWVKYAKEGTPPPAARQADFAKIELANFLEENKAIMFLPDGPIKERTMFQRHGAMIKFMFPFLRAVTQQSRFFASLIDDGINAAAKGDLEGLAHSLKSLIIGHVLVASAAGSHVLPNYIWGILASIDKEQTQKLKDAIDDGQKVLSGGYQIQDFGIKYLPYMKASGIFMEEKAERTLRALKPKDQQQVINAVIDGIAFGIVGRIGPQGTLNLGYLRERLQMGMEGHEDFRRYEENPIMQKIMGRPLSLKMVDRRLDFDIPQGLAHWLLKLENPAEVEQIKRGEAKADRQYQQDIRKIKQSWQHLPVRR